MLPVKQIENVFASPKLPGDRLRFCQTSYLRPEAFAFC
jgi:hypothetical protein